METLRRPWMLFQKNESTPTFSCNLRVLRMQPMDGLVRKSCNSGLLWLPGVSPSPGTSSSQRATRTPTSSGSAVAVRSPSAEADPCPRSHPDGLILPSQSPSPVASQPLCLFWALNGTFWYVWRCGECLTDQFPPSESVLSVRGFSWMCLWESGGERHPDVA